MNKILAVDGNSILNRAYYGIRFLSNSKGIPTNALTGYVNIIYKHIEALKPDAVVVAFDRKAPTFRHGLYDGYKANRKGMPDELAAQLPYAKKLSEYMGFQILEADGFEADDLLGTVSRRCKSNDAFCYILTGDRDSLQLIDDAYTHVLLAGNTDTVLFDEAKFFEKYQIEPMGLVDIKALMGDSSDCIPGVKGIGEKTAVALIAEYKTLDGVYANIDTLPVGPSAKGKIANDKDMAYLSRELAKIKCDVNVDVDITSRSHADFISLKELLVELEMLTVLKKITPYFSDDPSEDITPVSAPSFAEREIAPTDAYEMISEGYESVSVDFENGTVYLSDGKEVAYFNAQSDGIIDFVFSSLTKLCVYDSKLIYKHLIDCGKYPTDTAAFDVMLASYVVNSGLQKHNIERVVNQYLHIDDEAMNASKTAYYTALLANELKKQLESTGQSKLYYDIELPLALVIADMEETGFYVDGEGLTAFGEELEKDIKECEERIYFLTGEQFNINSPKQLGHILFEQMGIPAKKKTKTGYTTDAETLEPLAPYYPVVAEVLDYRALTKLKSTFIDAMVKVISEKDGRIHTSFNQATTATGRLSSAEPNLQNIPIRQKRGRELRKYFMGGGNKVLVDADYSQIELRLLAEISGDETFIDTFKSGEDIHRRTAASVFGIPEELISPELRTRAKAINFGIVYGISAFSLAKDIGTSVAEAKRYIENYLTRYGGVNNYLTTIVDKARADGFVTTLFGRRRYIPELTSDKKMLQGFGERVARNSPIQGTAADIIKLAMVNVYKKLSEFPNAKLVLQVHDELIIETDKESAEAVAEMLKTEMENVCKTAVPLSVEVKVGKTWYDTKE